MKNILIAVLLCFLGSGCGGSKEVEPSTPVNTLEVSKVPGLSSQNPAEVLEALRQLVDEYNTNPDTTEPIVNVEDLVTRKVLDRLPDPPAGRKFAIQNGTVVLQ